MKKVTNNILKGMASRFSATVMLFAMGCIAAFAQGNNKLYIEDFDIAPGETKTLDIILENDGPVSALQFDIMFPDGLNYIEGSLDRATTNRITRSSHAISEVLQGDDNSENPIYRMGFVQITSEMANSSVKDNSGAILTIQVKADYTYKGSFIKIFDICGSNGTIEDSELIDMPNCTVNAGVFVGELENDATNPILVRPTELNRIGFSLSNVIPVNGLEAIVELPEGVYLTVDELGDYFTYTNRLSKNTTCSISIISENTYKLLISSLTGDVFTGFEGTLFAINVAAKKSFDTGDIVIRDIKVSSVNGYSYEIYNEPSVTLTCVTDPDGDGVWNINDVYEVIDAYNSETPNSACDVNDDGVININDIYAVIDKY